MLWLVGRIDVARRRTALPSLKNLFSDIVHLRKNFRSLTGLSEPISSSAATVIFETAPCVYSPPITWRLE